MTGHHDKNGSFDLDARATEEHAETATTTPAVEEKEPVSVVDKEKNANPFLKLLRP